MVSALDPKNLDDDPAADIGLDLIADLQQYDDFYYNTTI